MVQKLEEKEVGFKSLTENIDTTTAGGRFFFHVFGALAEFERDLIRERVQAGLKSARARGRKGGRPPVPEETKAMAKILLADKSLSIIRSANGLELQKVRCINTEERCRRALSVLVIRVAHKKIPQTASAGFRDAENVS
jgi:DNA invertase Pin-like site-specific DNA recombinase